MSFQDDLKAEFEADRPFIDVPVKLNNTLHTFRFTRMDPSEWVNACDMCPARPGVKFDMSFGYNLRLLAPLAAAQSGKRLEDGVPVAMTPEEWSQLFKALPGGVVGKLADALFTLNEFDPMQEIAEAKKASEAALALSSASHQG